MLYVVAFGVVFVLALRYTARVRQRRSLQRLTEAAELIQQDDHEGARELIRLVLESGPDDHRIVARTLKMGLLSDEGATDEAVAMADGIVATMAEWELSECPWSIVNSVVIVRVNAGLYTDALSVSTPWTESQQARGAATDPESSACVRINEAEALCNLGRVEEALALLDDVHEAAAASPLAAAGLECLRSWIHVQAGRVDEARAVFEKADLSALASVYTAEVEYTRAAIERDSGNLDLASRHAWQGFAAANRASSQRNGIFMAAGVAGLQGDHQEARRLFEEGVSDRYQAQAGEGLNRYARLLESLGETDQVERVREMIAERDPEWRDPTAGLAPSE